MGRTGRRITRRSIGAAVVVALLAVLALGSCSHVSDPSCAAPAPGAFVGVAVSAGHGIVTYRSERVVESAASPVAELLARGGDLEVGYRDGNEQFIEVGQPYRVDVRLDRSDPARPRLESDIDEACGSFTVHADGSRIDTGPMARPWVRQLVWWSAGLVGALVFVATAAAAFSGFLERREDRELEEI